MKSRRWSSALVLLCLVGAGNAWADRGHRHFGVVVGPYWGPGYHLPYYSPYYYPPYYYPPLVVERAPPPVYIEQQTIPPAPAGATMAPPPNYWYYCRASKAYYPYVKECPSGWQKELPQPPGQP